MKQYFSSEGDSVLVTTHYFKLVNTAPDRHEPSVPRIHAFYPRCYLSSDRTHLPSSSFGVRFGGKIQNTWMGYQLVRSLAVPKQKAYTTSPFYAWNRFRGPFPDLLLALVTDVIPTFGQQKGTQHGLSPGKFRT